MCTVDFKGRDAERWKTPVFQHHTQRHTRTQIARQYAASVPSSVRLMRACTAAVATTKRRRRWREMRGGPHN